MSFLPELKEFLTKGKLIFTVRKYKMSYAIVTIEGIGNCWRIPLGEIKNKESLSPYVKDSGFPSLEAWWTKIKYFTPAAGVPLYLYRVEVL